MVRLGLGVYSNLRLARLGEPLQDERLCTLYIRLCAVYGVKRPPELRVCRAGEHLDSPLAYGFFHPVILLPEGVCGRWDERAFVGVTAHELVHIRRRDVWWKLASLWTVSLHWFNPLVYFAARRFAEETELACDAAVLAGCDAEARRGYGYVLLSILRRASSRKHTLGLTTQFNPSLRPLKARFSAIVDASPKRRGKTLTAFVLAICLCVGSFAACRFVQPDEADTSPTEPSESEDNEGSTPIPLNWTVAEPMRVAVTACDAAGWETVLSLPCAKGSLSFRIRPEDRVQCLIWEPSAGTEAGQDDLHTVCVAGMEGMPGTAVSLAWIDLWGMSIVRAEAVIGTRSQIAYYQIGDDAMVEVASGCNFAQALDLDGDGVVEVITGAGLSIPTYMLYTWRDGHIVRASLNDALSAAHPGEDNVYVEYQNGRFTLNVAWEREQAVYLDGALVPGRESPRVVDLMHAELPVTWMPDAGIRTSSYRLPYVVGENAYSTNAAIAADFAADLVGYGSMADFIQLQLAWRGQVVSTEMLASFGMTLERAVSYTTQRLSDGGMQIDVIYRYTTAYETMEESYRYTVRADGSLVEQIRPETAVLAPQLPTMDAPSLAGDVYLMATTLADGEDYMLLHLTPDRLYFVRYPDNGRLREETGLTSLHDGCFYLWQDYGISVGSHFYWWDEEQGGFIGDAFGDFRSGDLLRIIDRAEYERLDAAQKMRLAREAADTSLAAKIKLSTPMFTGDETDYLKLRVRVVNQSAYDAFVPASPNYTLEVRDAAYRWVPVACNGTPAATADGFIIPAFSEAVVDYDLGVYTALPEDNRYYRVVIYVTAGGETVGLTCTFSRGMPRLIQHNTAPADWHYTAFHDQMEAPDLTNGFSYSFDLFEDSWLGGEIADSAPWTYIRIDQNGLRVFLPLHCFTGKDEVLRWEKQADLILLCNGQPVQHDGGHVEFSESTAVYTIAFREPLLRTQAMHFVVSMCGMRDA